MSSSSETHSHPPPPTTTSSSTTKLSFIDIGANLLDEMYQGNYRGKQRHEADLLDIVLPRAFNNNIEKIIITCGTLEESKRGLEFIERNNNDDAQGYTYCSNKLFSTVGVHPTRCATEFGDCDDDDDELLNTYIQNLKNVILQGKKGGHVVAMGELGLDYARLEFSDKESQKRGLKAQLELAKDPEIQLPLFLHNRDSGSDLIDMLQKHYAVVDDENDENDDDNKKEKKTIQIRPPGGVVHSFDDTFELAQQFMDMGLYIGLNGCSLKTQDNLNVARQIPLDKLLLETDCPWCDIRASHAGFEYVTTKFDTKNEKKYDRDCCVKGRYEPVHIVQVAEVIAGVKGISVEEVASASKANALKLFGPLVKTVDRMQ